MARIDGTLRGAFAQGYTPELVNAILGPLSWSHQLRLAVVWDYVDTFGPGGDSDVFAVASSGGLLYPVAPDLLAFLLDDQGMGSDLVLDTLLTRTAGGADPAQLIELDGHNLARIDRRTRD